jgi:hypothetical protein
MRAEATDALISTISEAAVDQTLWQGIVEKVSAELSGVATALLIRRGQTVPELYLHAGYPAGAIEDFKANHADVFPWRLTPRKR